MSMTERREDPLVAHLLEIERDQDRATLAALRSSLREGHALDGLRVVLRFLPREESKWKQRRAEDDAILLAGLFALHPNDGPLSLASALRLLAEKSESIELRFRALLDAHRSDLATHLRHAVSLVAGEGHPIDWTDLRRAIRHWDHEDDFVRRDWSRDFWGREVQGDDPTSHTD